MPDYAAQRSTMVDTQLATNEVADLRVRAAMAAIAREQFLPAGKRAMAYCDVPVEVSAGRFLLDPRSFGKLVMLADIQPTDHVLDVGCTTGYSTAVLSLLAKSVVGLEQDADLVGAWQTICCRRLVSTNATAVQGTLVDGFQAKAPYDVIVVNGGIEEPPQKLLSQLGEGGRLVAIVLGGAPGRAHLFERDKGRVGSRVDFDAAAPVACRISNSPLDLFSDNPT